MAMLWRIWGREITLHISMALNGMVTVAHIQMLRPAA